MSGKLDRAAIRAVIAKQTERPDRELWRHR